MTPNDIEEFKIMLAEAFRLGADGRRPGSGCLDWFMSDADGDIAVFTGGGLDLVPVDVFDDERTFVDVYLYFLKRGTTDGRSEDYREWKTMICSFTKPLFPADAKAPTAESPFLTDRSISIT